METSIPLAPPSRLPALDRLGLTASVVCIVHCVALPALAVALPAAGTVWVLGEWLGWTAVATVALVAATTLPRGFSRHGKATPALLAVAGLFALAAGELLAGHGLVLAAALTLAGGLTVGLAQIQNQKLLRHCLLCGHSHCPLPQTAPRRD